MIIAHLPAGYLLSHTLNRKLENNKAFAAGLLGSLFPDFDLIYFYLIDHQQTFHREYITHLPFFWGCLSLLFLALFLFKSDNPYKPVVQLFLANVWLHLCLDTLMAPVYWFYPFSTEGLQILPLTIERHFDFWLWNYFLNPSILLELGICFAAGYVLMKRRPILIKGNV